MPVIDTWRYILAHPFNRDRKIRALANWLDWQLKSRMSGGTLKHRFVNDTYVYASAGMTGVTGNIYCGLHEWSEMAFTLHFLRPEDHFVDVGANIGTYTLLASGVVGAYTTAFEPGDEAFALLEKNIQLNSLESRVNLMSVGLSDTPGFVAFSIGQDTVNHVVSDDTEKSKQIEVRRLDDVMSDKDISILMKIDVEGYEYQVLKGAGHVLGDPGQVALIVEWNVSENSYGSNDGDMINLLEAYGYEPVTYDPYLRQLNRIGFSAIQANGIFVKDVDACHMRLKSAKRYVVQGKYI